MVNPAVAGTQERWKKLSDLGYVVWLACMALWIGAVVIFGMAAAVRSEDRVVKLHPREPQSHAGTSAPAVAFPDWVENDAYEISLVEERTAAPVAPGTLEPQAAHS
jgi:hypothetical protein